MSDPQSIMETLTDEFAHGPNVMADRRAADDRIWNRLDGRVILITGAARGLGSAQATLFAAEGARVVVTDILDDRGAELAKQIGDKAIYTRLDTTSDEDWDRAVSQATEAFGPINGLVHNAAIGTHGLIEQTATSDFAHGIDVNLIGAFRAIRASVAPMTKAGGGAIVLTSSIEAMAAHPALAGYCTAKAGLIGLARTASLELAPRGIRVNALCPGVVDTEMVRPVTVDRNVLDSLDRQIPLGSVAEPSDIARAALFLVSDDSRYVTGTSLVADGGVMAGMPLQLG